MANGFARAGSAVVPNIVRAGGHDQVPDSIRFHIMINEAAGSVDDLDRQKQEIEAAFAAVGVEPTVQAVDPADLGDEMRRAWGTGVDAVIVAGGDGTVSGAAGVAVEHQITLGVLPLGTFNHFAGDLGIPDSLDRAAAWLASARPMNVDAAEVNGTTFVNNASIGVYPKMVKIRDEIRERRGWGKIRAVPVAMASTLKRLPIHHFSMSVDGGTAMQRATPFLFVVNGLLDAGGTRVGERQSLDEGHLGIYVTATRSRLRLIADAITARFRGIDRTGSTERFVATSLEVGGNEQVVPIALDGEPMEMKLPLVFRSRPGALRVLGPVGEDDGAAPNDEH